MKDSIEPLSTAYISSSVAAADPELLLVDIRPLDERLSGIGFIAGSISLPMTPDTFDAASWRDVRADSKKVALVCMSGRRATDLITNVPLLGDSVVVLEGGMLAWSGEAFPTCVATIVPEQLNVRPSRPLEFLGHVRSCFVAEMTETSLNTGEMTHALGAIATLQDAFEQAAEHNRGVSRATLLDTLDRLALYSVRAGTPMDRVTTNLDHMIAFAIDSTSQP